MVFQGTVLVIYAKYILLGWYDTEKKSLESGLIERDNSVKVREGDIVSISFKEDNHHRFIPNKCWKEDDWNKADNEEEKE